MIQPTFFKTHVVSLSGVLFAARLRARSRRTLLGHLWILIPATLACLIASLLRDHGALTADVPAMPYVVFVFAGMSFWQTFVDALQAPLQQFSYHRAILIRLRFPHEALMLVGLWDTALNAGVRLVVLLLLCLALGVPLTTSVTWVPLVIAGIALLGLGCGLLLTPFSLLYDDVGRALPMALMLLFFVMPVAYPLRATGWELLNPVLPLITAGRAALVGAPVPDPLWLPVLLTMVAWLAALPLNRLAKEPLIERLG